MAKLYWQVSTQRTVYLKNSHHAMKPWHPWCLFDQRLGRDQRHLSASGCLFYEEPFSSIESVESISQSSRCCSGRDTFCLLGFDWNENDGWDYTWRCGSGESLPYCRTSLYAQSIKPFLIFWIVMSNQCVALRWANYFGYHERAALTPQPLCSCNTSWPRASGHWHKFLWERAVKQASSKASRSCHATSSRRPWGTLHQPPRHRSPRSGLPVFLFFFLANSQLLLQSGTIFHWRILGRSGIHFQRRPLLPTLLWSRWDAASLGTKLLGQIVKVSFHRAQTTSWLDFFLVFRVVLNVWKAWNPWASMGRKPQTSDTMTHFVQQLVCEVRLMDRSQLSSAKELIWRVQRSALEGSTRLAD